MIVPKPARRIPFGRPGIVRTHLTSPFERSADTDRDSLSTWFPTLVSSSGIRVAVSASHAALVEQVACHTEPTPADLPNDWLAGDAGSVYYGVKVAEKQVTQLLQLELQRRRRDVL